MATIGSIVIGLSATTGQLKKDLSKGANAVGSFVKNVATGSAKIVGDLAQIGLKGAAGASAGLGAFALSAADTIDKAGDMADRLGTTTSNLLALRYAAKLTGSETEALDGSLAKMSVNLGRAATEGGPAADALKRINLDARKLAEMDPTQAFIAIAGGLEKVPNPAEKAALAMDLFGKGGIGVLASLNAGPAALKKFSDEFQAFGGVTEATRQGIGSMFDAFDRIGSIVGAVGGKLAAELSPFIVAAGEQLAQLASTGINSGELVSRGVGYMVEAIAMAADVIDTLRLGFLLFQKSSTHVIANITRALGGFASTIGYVIQETIGLETGFGDTLKQITKNLEELDATQTDTLLSAASGDSYGDKIRKTFDDIKRGAAEAKSSINNMTKGVGAIGPAMDKSGEAAAKLFDTMKSDAARFTEEAATPLEKFQQEQAKLGSLLKAGLVTQTTVDRLTAKGTAELAGGPKTSTRAAALELGSKEARSAILDHRTQVDKSTKKPAEETAKNTAKQVDQQAATNVLLGSLVTALRGKAEQALDFVF